MPRDKASRVRRVVLPARMQDGRDAEGPITAAVVADLATETAARLAHQANTSNPHSVTAAQVGALTPAQVLARASLRG